MSPPLAPPSDPLPKSGFPAWIFECAPPESLEEAAFSSGSALALLHGLLCDPILNVPSELLKNRLALRAAQNCCKIEGRAVTEADLRDAYLLALPGDAMGPNGDMLALWRGGSDVSLHNTEWQGRLVGVMPDDLQEGSAEALDVIVSGAGTPVTKAAFVLKRILNFFPRQEAIALLCAEAVLSHALGWERPRPLLSLHLKRSDLRQGADGGDIRLACHVAVARGAQDAIRLSHDLARRADHLRAVAPKLRTKGSEDAIKLFLSEDAVLPSTMLSPTVRGSSISMTGRSARRFCGRLVELGVARELTGRATFRLYGVA